MHCLNFTNVSRIADIPFLKFHFREYIRENSTRLSAGDPTHIASSKQARVRSNSCVTNQIWIRFEESRKFLIYYLTGSGRPLVLKLPLKDANNTNRRVFLSYENIQPFNQGNYIGRGVGIRNKWLRR
ncbi:hypothetical protein OO17_09840 [Rhodopseudomonas palustris]|uniref:Uncharacterized protein n=1 Tax=Rhodopseudomonas palustris TaxID=1076 RepID=A0A0D7EYC3_RHOPL|nr:hypothetical protein OO17_09840 [Rhodopseudomonas palustris]